MEFSYVPKNNLNMNTQREVVELKYDQFDQVTGCTEYISVIKFWANWCLPCEQIAPYYEKLPHVPMYKNVRFYSVNANQNEDTILHCGVCTVPTFQLFFRGKMIDEIKGADMEKLQARLKQHLINYNLSC